MTVIAINGDYEGFLGVAKDVKTAIKYLIDKKLITDKIEVAKLSKEKNLYLEWCPLYQYFGDNWKTKIKNLSLKEFNIMFTCNYELIEVEVIGTEK